MTMWLRQFRRGQVHVPRKQVFCCTNIVRFPATAEESVINHGTFALRSVPPTLLATENQQAKAGLRLFLKGRGSSNAVAARTVNNSDLFIGHLVSRLRPLHEYRYLVGRELTSKALLEEHCKDIVVVGAVKKLTNSQSEEKCLLPVPPGAKTAVAPKKKKAMARVTEIGPTGKLPSNVIYLMELGMGLKEIERVTYMYPCFASLSVERNLRPLVDFLLDIGVPKTDIPTLIIRSPRICRLRLVEDIISTMTFLESFGVDKKNWGKVIYKRPSLLSHRRGNIDKTVEFFCKMGIPLKSMGKIIADFPSIICYSVENNLQPTADYFESLGVNVEGLLCSSPQTFGLSIEHNLRPVTGFFLERGFSTGELGTMISKFGSLYAYSLAGNLAPKWEFFSTMNYSRLELVKFPTYFGYSLDQRIKPRYALVKDRGVDIPLSQLLCLSVGEFNKALEKKVKKLVGNKVL